jgi:hypothetical protein
MMIKYMKPSFRPIEFSDQASTRGGAQIALWLSQGVLTELKSVEDDAVLYELSNG